MTTYLEFPSSMFKDVSTFISVVEQPDYNINRLNTNGYTLFHLACGAHFNNEMSNTVRNIDIVRYLLSNINCDPTIVSIHGKNAFHFACRTLEDVYEYKITRAFDVNKLTSENMHMDGLIPIPTDAIVKNLVHAQNNTDDIFRLLLEDGRCNPFVADKNGCTSLHLACQINRVDIVNICYKVVPKMILMQKTYMALLHYIMHV